jgi:hypothetical protein
LTVDKSSQGALASCIETCECNLAGSRKIHGFPKSRLEDV